MRAKKICQSIVVVAMLAASFAATGSVMAVSGICNGYMTVQSGDTLSSIAATCGTTVENIQAANPGIGATVHAGQVLLVATGNSSASTPIPAQMGSRTYVVQSGDTLSGIAFRYGVSLSDIMAVNPQIWNTSLIYPGQVINLPAMAGYTTPTYFPTPYYPPNSIPTPKPPSPFSKLRITYGHGLLVRTGPGTNYTEIQSPFLSAVKNTIWPYLKSSLTIDPSTGFVWVEIDLGQTVNGYSMGWIVVRDGLGSYFTDPNIGPKIVPGDP